MPNFPGSSNALPGVYTLVETYSSGLAIPSGVRLAVIMGEGARRETLVASANGGGNDGLNSSYTGTNGADGRHFLLSTAPIVSNRTTLYKNGIPLVGLEGTIDGTAFSTDYDYKISITDGKIELQRAHLVDQGGQDYAAGSLNQGNGTIGTLTLLDVNAPSETWTVRCSSVRRDGYGDPIDGYAKFIAVGSVSGNVLDGYGNQVFWQSNGELVDNTILSFAITEGTTAFREGDYFTIQVDSGVLSIDDSLAVTYIAEIDINDLEFFTDLDELSFKHGSPSLTNRLSLGAQLVFANGTPGVWACQTAPAVPRRVSYLLEESASGGATQDDMTFALPLAVVPDTDTNINLFVTDPVTGVESQLLPNKVTFYDATITADPYGEFIDNPLYTYSYTVILDEAVVKEDNDGVLAPTGGATATLASASVDFTADDKAATRSVKIFNATNAVNNGTFTIANVVDGKLVITGAAFVAESGLEFQVIDTSEDSAKVLFTDDLSAQLAAGASLRASIVDTRDADFFDVGWISAYESIERIDIDIVVPLPSQTISAIFQNGAAHVRTMSNIKNRKERVLFIGAIAGLDPANVIGTELAAVEDIGILEGIQGDDVTEILAGNIEDLTNYGVQSGYGSTFRVVYFYPDQIVMQIGADRTLVDGFFMAAAGAGWFSGTPNVALPLTRKVLTGFTILRDKMYRPIVLEQLTAAGITVLQPVAGGGTVIRGQTTTNSGFAEEREISVVFIRDRIAKQLRTAFDGFVGQVDSPIFQSGLVARAKATLAGFVGQSLITQWKDLKVTRDTVDPTQWNITVKVQPVYPVNFIFIKVSVGLL